MKKTIVMMIALLCTIVQGAWAQALVDSEAELRDAVGKGGTIQMIGSIQLSSPLTIANGKTVTLDLNTTKLSRNLNSAQGDGSVIHVEKGGSLTILDSNTGHNGTIQGGWATRGGGVYNEGTLTLESGYITQCKASLEGGAIFNTGTLVRGDVGTFYLQAAQYNNRNLFDGDYNTYWSKSSRYKEGDGRWRVYFNSSRPIMIKSYSIVTCNLSRYVPEENPTRWSLYGIRNNEKVILDWRDSKTPGEALSDKPGVKSNYEVRYNNKEPLQLFVFECPAAVSKTWWKYAVGGFGREEVTIAEIELHE